jgi:hypothetical protein
MQWAASRLIRLVFESMCHTSSRQGRLKRVAIEPQSHKAIELITAEASTRAFFLVL